MSDAKSALRSLRRNPRFVAMTAGVLAVGLGAAMAIFVAVDAALLRSLPLPPAEQGLVVRVLATDPERPGREWPSTSYPVFTDYRDGATSFAVLAAFADGTPVNIGAGDEARGERVEAGLVSGTYFEVFAARPAVGRLLVREDDLQPGGHPVAVLGHGLWRRRFGGDPGVVGRVVRINGHPFTVIGVARRDFVGASFGATAELWLPMAMARQAMPAWSQVEVLGERGFHWVSTIGRLRPGSSIAAAQAELDAIAAERAAGQAVDKDPFARVVPAAGTGFGTERGEREMVDRTARVLALFVSLVLAVACANAAGLLLAHGERRRAEFALRLCLGASRRRVVGQLVIEGLLVAGLATAAGFAVAALLLAFLAKFAEGFPLPLAALTPLDHPRALAFAATLAAVCGVAFSLAPAFRLVAPVVARLSAALRGEPASGSRRRFGFAGRGALIVTQVALSTALLAGSLFLLRTLAAASRVDLGFAPAGAAVASVDLALQGYSRERGAAAWGELLAAVRAEPGVARAALGRTVPVQGAGMIVTVKPEGYVFSEGEKESVLFNVISPEYFSVLGVRRLAGREFEPADRTDGPSVAIVNRAFAERFWGKGVAPADVIGKRVEDVGPRGAGVEIVGVVDNAKLTSVRETPYEALYLPLAQSYLSGLTIVARATPGFDAALLPAAIGRSVERFDPELPVYRARTLEEHLAVTLAAERATAALFSAFALLALGLVASGLYGLVAFTMAQRWREIGIRMALGARERQVLSLALRQAAALAAIGAALGAGLALALGRGLAGLLYGVGPADGPTLLGAALVLVAVAIAAGFVPARRAARMNPAAALRRE